MNLKITFLIALHSISNLSFAQENKINKYGQGIVVGHIDKLYSDVLDEERELLIYLPENWNNKDYKREKGYSPTTANDPEKYGGGDRFLEFMKTDLFPYIEDQYPAARESSTFIGHSFGGVAVLNAMSRHHELFENYGN